MMVTLEGGLSWSGRLNMSVGRNKIYKKLAIISVVRKFTVKQERSTSAAILISKSPLLYFPEELFVQCESNFSI